MLVSLVNLQSLDCITQEATESLAQWQFTQRDDFELVRADKSCDGWHAAKVQGVEYYQMKNGEKYEIEFEIKEEK